MVCGVTESCLVCPLDCSACGSADVDQGGDAEAEGDASEVVEDVNACVDGAEPDESEVDSASNSGSDLLDVHAPIDVAAPLDADPAVGDAPAEAGVGAHDGVAAVRDVPAPDAAPVVLPSAPPASCAAARGATAGGGAGAWLALLGLWGCVWTPRRQVRGPTP